MREIKLQPGLVVVANGQVCKVHSVISINEIEVVSQKESRRFTVTLDKLEFIPSVSPAGTATISPELDIRAASASSEEIALSRKRHEIIQRHLAGDICRKNALIELEVSESQFYRIRASYSEEGGFYSLLRGARGPKKGSYRLSDEVETIIEMNIDKHYRGAAATISKVEFEVRIECQRKGLTPPSRTAVRARIKRRCARDLHKMKYGADSASQKHDARPGKHLTSRPLEWVQMDHTRVDIFIVDEVRRLPIARPWLTILIDQHTRVVLGYYLALHAPSAVSISCALSHAALPKFSFMDKMGLDGDKYPFYGVPAALHMDNAQEFKSRKFVSACDRNRITAHWRPYGRKHYGGHVERLIGTFMTSKVHFLPGSTYSNVVQRKEYDSEKSSAMTFKEFSKWFAREVCVYHAQRHSALGCSPAAFWKRYFEADKEAPLHPPIVSNPFKFRLDFMPELYRKIRPEGIKANGHIYWDASLNPYVGRSKVMIKYDPFSLKTIWVSLGGEYIPVHFADATIADLTLSEHRARNRQGKRSGKIPVGGLDDLSLAEYAHENNALVDESKRLTKKVRASEAALSEYMNGPREQLVGSNDSIEDDGVKDRPNYSRRAVPFKGKNYD